MAGARSVAASSGLGDRGGALEQTLTFGLGCLRHGGLEQLAHATVGEVALELVGPGAQARDARPGGNVRGRAQQAGLAEPGGTLHKDQPAAALPGIAQCAAELGELPLTLE